MLLQPNSAKRLDTRTCSGRLWSSYTRDTSPEGTQGSTIPIPLVATDRDPLKADFRFDSLDDSIGVGRMMGVPVYIVDSWVYNRRQGTIGISL